MGFQPVAVSSLAGLLGCNFPSLICVLEGGKGEGCLSECPMAHFKEVFPTQRNICFSSATAAVDPMAQE